MTTLTNDGVLVAAELLGVQTLPVVLSIGPQQDCAADMAAARAAAHSALVEAGVVDGYGDVAADLATAMRVLERPDQELAARVYSGPEVRRICLARRGSDGALAVRHGARIEVSVCRGDGAAALTRQVLDALKGENPAEIPTFSGPTDQLRDTLAAADDPDDVVRLGHHLGLSESDAAAFGSAMTHCSGLAEIIAHAYDDGAAIAAPGAVAVYDSPHGMLLASPSVAPDGALWSTFAACTRGRLARAVSALAGSIPEGRWPP
ncbi:MAG: ESX secretion-associated protein EspG [Mycobacteriaceae bacterium]|nr:ESX secretion-associated protein EspG [Mycobacteriaceae bacterium]